MNHTDYVQQLWQQHAARDEQNGRVGRAVAWVVGVAAVVAVAAYLLRDYITPYLHL